jgi:hypothetical protein
MSTAASSTHSDSEDSPRRASPDAAKNTLCQWDGCGDAYSDAEELYRHLCDDHVGRKSTNNLCLTCKWTGCDVSCAKRDHITSHLRGESDRCTRLGRHCRRRSCPHVSMLIMTPRSAHAAQAALVRCMRQDVQAAAGPQEA